MFSIARSLAMLRILSLSLSAGLLTTASGRAEDTVPTKGQPIDVVICLDVSNSMDGLIASAKLKLWDIVNDLARIKPTPELRVGLYSYGHTQYDAKAGWVRKELDLTNDLDALYQKLNGLTTNGGEEYVARVCRDALQQQKWSKEKKALRLIFVCGNEPASQDPTLRLKTVGDLAQEMDVVINPIFCGPVTHPDSRDWKDFATLAKGKFASIDQNRGTVAIPTPFDKELTVLSSKLNTTYVAYGKDGAEKARNQAMQDRNADKAPGAAPARAQAKAGTLYKNSTWDLVDRLKDDPKFDVKTLKEEDLCDEMKKLKPEEREKHLKDMLAKRQAIQKEIGELSSKRAEFISKETKKNPNPADKAFDEAIKSALREQGAARGLKLPE
jgi:hypothetical protein